MAITTIIVHMPEDVNEQISKVSVEAAEKLKSSRRSILAQMIPTALEIFLITIDQCHYLIEHSPKANTSAANPLSQRYRGLISSKEQRELDKEVRLYLNAVEESTLEKMAEMTANAENNRAKPESHYPVAQEALGVMYQTFLERNVEEKITEYFGEYFSDPIKFEYILTKVRLGKDSQTEAALGAALVPLIVGKLEVFLAALIRTGITLHPNSLGGLPDIPNEIFQKYRENLSGADIIRWQIDQKVKSSMDGPPNEWQKRLQQWTKIDIAEVGADWDMVTEVIQRRHVIVHNDSLVDTDYLKNVANGLTHGLHLGDYLLSDPAYFVPVLIELETWAQCLANKWAKHFFKSEALYNVLTTYRVTELEAAGRWTQALAILNSVLNEPLPSDIDFVQVSNINRFFCLQELGRENEAVRREILALDVGDTPLYEIGKYALIRDYAGLIKRIRHTTQGSEASIDKKHLKELPLIKRAMRESRPVRSLLASNSPNQAVTTRSNRMKRHR